MTRTRLIEMIDLVLSCKNWGYADRVDIQIDNTGGHEIYVYPLVNRGGESIRFYCMDEFGINAGERRVYDPDFKKAEAFIREVKKRVEESDDD